MSKAKLHHTSIRVTNDTKANLKRIGRATEEEQPALKGKIAKNLSLCIEIAARKALK